MDIKDLNKSQLILLALLISFVTSIASAIATVSLLEQAPAPVTQTINRVVKNTIERVVQSDSAKKPALSADESKLLNQLKTVGSFVATIVVRIEGTPDKVVGSGFFFGDNRVIVAPALLPAKDKEIYIIQSIFGEQEIDKMISEKDYSILELKKKEVVPPTTDNPVTPPTVETPVTPASAEQATTQTPTSP
jgi:hypothetical protein